MQKCAASFLLGHAQLSVSRLIAYEQYSFVVDLLDCAQKLNASDTLLGCMQLQGMFKSCDYGYHAFGET